METINDTAMLDASNLTARQLEQAIDLVKAEFGANHGGGNQVLIAAVLGTRVRIYGVRLAAAGR